MWRKHITTVGWYLNTDFGRNQHLSKNGIAMEPGDIIWGWEKLMHKDENIWGCCKNLWLFIMIKWLFINAEKGSVPCCRTLFARACVVISYIATLESPSLNQTGFWMCSSFPPAVLVMYLGTHWEEKLHVSRLGFYFIQANI